MNEYKSAIQIYDESPAENCVENDDGTVYNDHLLDEGQWVDVAQLVCALFLALACPACPALPFHDYLYR